MPSVAPTDSAPCRSCSKGTAAACEPARGRQAAGMSGQRSNLWCITAGPVVQGTGNQELQEPEQDFPSLCAIPSVAAHPSSPGPDASACSLPPGTAAIRAHAARLGSHHAGWAFWWDLPRLLPAVPSSCHEKATLPFGRQGHQGCFPALSLHLAQAGGQWGTERVRGHRGQRGRTAPQGCGSHGGVSPLLSEQQPWERSSVSGSASLKCTY